MSSAVHMDRRGFLKALGSFCAALAIPLAWKTSSKPPIRFYSCDNIALTFNGARIVGITSIDYSGTISKNRRCHEI